MSAWFDYWLNNIDELQKINWLAPKEAKKSQRFNRGAGFFSSLSIIDFFIFIWAMDFLNVLGKLQFMVMSSRWQGHAFNLLLELQV